MERERFAAVDVETANDDPGSICEIGIVIIEDGREVERYNTLVDPRCRFGLHQTRVHGITSEKVAGCPSWGMIAGRVRDVLGELPVAAHSGFDRRALKAACGERHFPALRSDWIDTTTVLRRAWPEQFGGRRPCSLSAAAEFFNVTFSHHKALDDARMSALILVRAMQHTGKGLFQWQVGT